MLERAGERLIQTQAAKCLYMAVAAGNDNESFQSEHRVKIQKAQCLIKSLKL